MASLSTLQDLSKPVDMTGWPDPYADGTIPQPIAPVRPLATPGATAAAAATPTTSATGVTAGIINAAGNMLGLPAGSLPGTSSGSWVQQIETYVATNLENFVFIIIGLILIAAGVFSFKAVQDTVMTTARRAAEVAA
jgi:hypothetical protein